VSEQRLKKTAVFLDRDGTICEEVGYLNHVSRFHMFPFAPASIRRLNDSGLLVFVITNQSGVARGYYPESLVQAVHDLMTKQLSPAGAHLDGIYYCPHSSTDACACRKPGPGMLHQASAEHGVHLKRSFVVGDRHSDVELAHSVGARSIMVRTGYGEGEIFWHADKWRLKPDFIAANLASAVDWILEQTN
jgi:D-glycero-D-manno-heptose 1,7-bisphosphate phosphatase